MVYITGSDDLPYIIDIIVDGLIASSADWTDGDITWDTTDKTLNNARRCVKYTGDTDDIWFAFESINSYRHIYYSTNQYGKGLQVTVSASWDDINHNYPDSNQQTFLSFEVCTGAVNADLATLLLTYYGWYDATGFVITAKPEPNTVDNYQSTFTLCIEHVSTKEYSDGYSNFFVTAVSSAWQWYDDSRDPNTFWVPYIRPFKFVYTYEGKTSNCGTPFPSSGILTPSRAIKSDGDNKIYYMKPIYQNEQGDNDHIAEAALWVYWQEDAGIIDGDLIVIEGETTKYICKSVDSPDSAGRRPIAIKYVA